jgi:hypothetical protein
MEWSALLGSGARGEGDGSTGRVHREGETKRETKRERVEVTRWSGVVGGAVVAGLLTASDTALRHYGMAWPTTGTSSEQAGSGWRVASVQGRAAAGSKQVYLYWPWTMMDTDDGGYG